MIFHFFKMKLNKTSTKMVAVSPLETFIYSGCVLIIFIKMDLGSIVLRDFQANFLNLSLLICHLFTSGNFRQINILYHPNSFDNRLYGGIESTCLSQIPMTTIDISISEIPSIDPFERTDYIFQLIFLPPEQLSYSFHRVKRLLTFYRAFVFSGVRLKSTGLESDWRKSANFIANSNTSSLLLIHDALSDATKLFLLSKYLNNSVYPIYLQNRSQNDLLNTALAEKEFEHFLTVSYFSKVQDCINKDSFPMKVMLEEMRIVTVLYFKFLNMRHVDGYVMLCDESGYAFKTKKIRPILKSVDSEFANKFESVSDENM